MPQPNATQTLTIQLRLRNLHLLGWGYGYIKNVTIRFSSILGIIESEIYAAPGAR